MSQQITIRRSNLGDLPALARLAALDSARPLHGPAVVAEVGGDMRAAVALDGSDAVIADPFHATSDLVELLRLRAAQTRADEHRARGHVVRALRPAGLAA